MSLLIKNVLGWGYLLLYSLSNYINICLDISQVETSGWTET